MARIYLLVVIYSLSTLYLLRADEQRQKREKEEKSKQIELCIIRPGQLEQDPLLGGGRGGGCGQLRRGSSPELRFSSFLGLDQTEASLLAWLERWRLDAKQIDVTSRLLFPLSFLLFTSSYWVYYTQIDHID